LFIIPSLRTNFIIFIYRDLLKWCKRIAGVDLSFEGLGFASSDCKFIYNEVFALSIFYYLYSLMFSLWSSKHVIMEALS
jgi:hypothetical protein